MRSHPYARLGRKVYFLALLILYPLLWAGGLLVRPTSTLAPQNCLFTHPYPLADLCQFIRCEFGFGESVALLPQPRQIVGKTPHMKSGPPLRHLKALGESRSYQLPA